MNLDRHCGGWAFFMKLTKRKGFNFFRSYYDVYNELSNKDKVMFIDALLDRQFLGIKPDNLTGMAKFAYISQTNSIDSQVKGFEDKTGIILTPTEPPTDGGAVPPSLQVEEKGKEKVEVQVQGEVQVADLDIWPSFDDFWDLYDKKTDRPKCEKKWKKLNKAVKYNIMHHLEHYVRSTPDKVYRKNPATYLNNECWNDEIITTNGNQNGLSKKEQHTASLIRDYQERWGSDAKK